MRILLANLTKMVGDSGGVAKVTSNFATEMEKRGHTVSLIHNDEKEGAFFYPVNGSVACYNLRERADGSIVKMPAHLIFLREAYRIFNKTEARTFNSGFMKSKLLDNLKRYVSAADPEIIIAFQAAASKLLLCDLDVKVPVITMFHDTPEDSFRTNLSEELPALAKSAVCQVLLPPFEQQLKRFVPDIKTVVIGNVVPQFAKRADLSKEKKQYKIVFVGTLNKARKKPHLLVEAFSLLADRYHNWVLELWGAATNKAYLKELQFMIVRNHLENRAFIKGVSDDIPNVLLESDIFAWPTASEGFGMALTEAMSIGLAVAGSKNCIATRYIIDDGENGLLFEDRPDSIATTLEKLIESRDLRAKLGENAKKYVQQFAPEIIWDRWETLMREVTQKAASGSV